MADLSFENTAAYAFEQMRQTIQEDRAKRARAYHAAARKSFMEMIGPVRGHPSGPPSKPPETAPQGAQGA